MAKKKKKKKKFFLCDNGVLDILKSKRKIFCQGKRILILADLFCCTPERFINYCLFIWTGVLRKINIAFQAKKTGIYMVCAMLPATVLHFARAPKCPASQLSLLMFNRKSSRTQHISAPALQNEFGNCTMVASKFFLKYLVNKSVLRGHQTVESNRHLAVVG